MIVAIYQPTNDGTYAALIDGPGYDSETEMVDGYEVDTSVKSFATVEEAEAWLAEQISPDASVSDMVPVVGGRVVTY